MEVKTQTYAVDYTTKSPINLKKALANIKLASMWRI